MFCVLLFMRFLMLALAMTGLLGQSPKEFDVVSVKPSAPDEHNSFMFRRQSGGLRALGMPLRMMIMQAYDVKSFQILGGPDWVRRDRWDVLAKVEGVEGQIPMAQIRPMLQSLMGDRFQLKVRIETKEMPIYALVMEKNGSKLAPSIGSEEQFRMGYGSVSAKKGGVAALTALLSRELERVVIDKTELKGVYDYNLKWTPQLGQGGPESIGMSADTPFTPPTESNGPSIFTALQEQLGLRLVSQKGPVEMIVIDSVERPSAN
jgi:uncharacterized protein (TIGR03435 family)